MAQVEILGVRHRRAATRERLRSYVMEARMPRTFLLEYDDDSFRTHMSDRSKPWARLFPENEFWALTMLLRQRGVPYRFIDIHGPEYRRRFVEEIGLTELLRLVFHRKNPSGIARISPGFGELMLRKREEEMAAEIVREAARGGSITVVVGRDHLSGLADLLGGRLTDVASVSL